MSKCSCLCSVLLLLQARCAHTMFFTLFPSCVANGISWSLGGCLRGISLCSNRAACIWFHVNLEHALFAVLLTVANSRCLVWDKADDVENKVTPSEVPLEIWVAAVQVGLRSSGFVALEVIVVPWMHREFRCSEIYLLFMTFQVLINLQVSIHGNKCKGKYMLNTAVHPECFSCLCFDLFPVCRWHRPWSGW